MTVWLREIDDKKIVEAFLDFSVAFDIIDPSLLLQKLVSWLYTLCYIVDKELPV